MASPTLKQIADALKMLEKQAVGEFSRLSEAQINAKPGPREWSVGECLAHIIKTNETYYPVIDRILEGKYRPGFWARISPFSKKFGRMLVGMVHPHNAKKSSSPAAFDIGTSASPERSAIPGDIVKQFQEHLRQLQDKIGRMKEAELPQTMIASPAAWFITYTMHEALQILVFHTDRHIQQAVRVRNNLKK